MMKSCTRLLISILAGAAPSFVSAHGFVYQVGINKQSYTGNVPNATPNPSAIRQINDVGPVKGASNPYLNCGQDAQLGSQVLNANPGDMFTFDWRGGDLSDWPHNTGPMLTYMTSCGSTTCDKFVSANAQWFKIDQLGRQADGTWVQQDLMNGGVANVSLPSNIAPGNYLIRHEIIALHLATSLGGAEFYPSCTQLQVGGTGNGAPTADELVSLPGAYSDNDPGIYDPNIYDTSAPYTFPGPPIAKFVLASSGSSNPPASGVPPATATATTAASNPATTSPPKTASSGSCRLRKQTSTENINTANYPRHISRVMRRLIFDRYH